MATGVRTATWATSGDANWQAWCNAVYNVLIDAGWVQTSDTGQRAVPAADTYPAANTFTYWIFRLNDAAQTNAPVYLKFEVARGTGTSNARFQITIGTGTNGAGTITGTVWNGGAQAISTTGWVPSTTTPTEFRACVSSGCAWFLVYEDTACFFSVHRRLDSSGNVTDNGYIAASQVAPSGSIINVGVWEKASGTYTISSAAPVGLYQCPATLTAGVRTGTGSTSPIWPITHVTSQGRFQYAGAYGASAVDIGQGVIQSINQFGLGAKNYLMASGGSSATIFPYKCDAKAQTLARLLLIWDT